MEATTVPKAAPGEQRCKPENETEQQLSPRKRYTNRRAIGNSLYGRVFFARDNAQPGKPAVAVKLSNRVLMENRVSVANSRVLESPAHEAAIMRTLPAHRNVIQLVDEHLEPDLHWLAMEYVDGGELFDVVITHGALAESSVANALAQVSSGLYHLHQHGYAHLDVSLENVLLSQHDGVLKLCDLGVAQQVSPSSPYLAPYQKERPGKLNCMAPEVLAGHDYFDAFKADVFSLGVMTFSMLIGAQPFEFAAPKDPRYAMIAQGRLREMLKLLRITHLSESMLDLLEGMLHPEPSKRMSLTDVLQLAHPFLFERAHTLTAVQQPDPIEGEASLPPSPAPDRDELQSIMTD